ncbi:heme exporter protein CcmD [Pectobacterium atrosepticum]|uniref:heme exporter protein CcmD n=1 Tax=Pectobacterium atrosepticum TaxID=29471 RepID=UPI0003A463CB|nr:heme exporter protein CcmD [Pectobacterium atrosepticum]GKV84017.1 heme exporter protein D [Pectobacterium carotovorum subsp. carotovorum]AIA70727.1 cell shape determination protein CcmD [Pectobacterium atrosepticum]AIK14505.1 heme exporter protein D [Pectobacterium atrosepticum]ATY91254.1 heme exporter protein CcmD [Pectobacterium atrosepticum]KFX17812.1 cell shape determination protein CcmD [Pectobacterium atrosepticum]
MNIAFTSWQDFFAMGGYALYVWLAVVLTLLPLSALIGHTLLGRRALLRDIRRQQARDQRKSTARQSETMGVVQ